MDAFMAESTPSKLRTYPKGQVPHPGRGAARVSADRKWRALCNKCHIGMFIQILACNKLVVSVF
jgi:hypothetical protein